MKPTYNYYEMVQLIQAIDCSNDVEIIKFLLYHESNRYRLRDYQSLIEKLRMAAIAIRK